MNFGNLSPLPVPTSMFIKIYCFKVCQQVDYKLIFKLVMLTLRAGKYLAKTIQKYRYLPLLQKAYILCSQILAIFCWTDFSGGHTGSGQWNPGPHAFSKLKTVPFFRKRAPFLGLSSLF